MSGERSLRAANLIMQKRERILAAAAIGAGLLFFGAPLVESQFRAPIETAREQVEGLRNELADARLKEAKLKAAMHRLQRWRIRSLPPNPVDAQRLYLAWLTDLAQISELSDVTVTPGRRSPKGKTCTAVLVTVEGKAPLSKLGRFLVHVQRADLAHRIASLSIESNAVQGDPPLEFTLTAEGLSFPEAPARARLFPATALSAEFRSGSEDGTCTVTDATGFPKTPGFRVRIGHEILEVAAIEGTRWTVRGARDGTRAGTHAAGETVELVPIAPEYAARSIDVPGRFVAGNPFVVPPPPSRPVAPPQTTPVSVPPLATPPSLRPTEDIAADTVLSATIVADGRTEAWFYRKSTGKRTVVGLGQELDAGSVRGTLRTIAADHVIVSRDGSAWKILLGDELRHAQKLPVEATGSPAGTTVPPTAASPAPTTEARGSAPASRP